MQRYSFSFLVLSFLTCVAHSSLSAQILTREDSLAAGLQLKDTRSTAISGYGEIFYAHDLDNNLATATLKRTVLFIGHRFTPKITFFSELELENARVSAGSPKGEISMEQAFIKFDLNRQTYISAGFLIPRIGIINENHLPTTFNGNERPVLESTIIPATWREVGACLYGTLPRLGGLNYSLGVFNGLDASGFGLEDGIRGGRQEGNTASARQKAVTGAVLYYYGSWRLQASAYVGGSVGVDNKTADLLGLSTGAFGTPVFLYEANAQYRNKGISLKAIATQARIPDAAGINTAYSNNTPQVMQGAYVEAGYDVLYPKFQGAKQFTLFSRYEYIDMNAKLSENAIQNPYFTQHHAFLGFTFLPVRGVGIKADYHFTANGAFNQSLIVIPPPYALPWYTRRHAFNLGLCYSF